MFRAHVLMARRAKLHYKVSGMITPIGGRPLHGTVTYRCDDTHPLGHTGLVTGSLYLLINKILEKK